MDFVYDFDVDSSCICIVFVWPCLAARLRAFFVKSCLHNKDQATDQSSSTIDSQTPVQPGIALIEARWPLQPLQASQTVPKLPIPELGEDNVTR